MNRKYILPIFILLLCSISIAPFVVEAATLQSVLTSFKNNLTALGAVLATISFIIAGLMFLLATTNPDKMKDARMALVAAIIGIAIIALSQFADPFVRNLFGLP